MAITEVASQRASSGDNNGADSATLAFPNNVTAGNLLIVVGAAWATGSAPASIAVTDTLSTTYTVVLGGVPDGVLWRTFIAYGVAPSSGACTVTVNPAGSSGSFSFSVNEFTGQHATPGDINGGASVGTSTSPSDAINGVAANALIIGCLSHEGTTMTLSPGTNYTTWGENETNVGNQCHHALLRFITTAGNYTVTATTGSSTNWELQTHSFKPAIGGAAFPFPPVHPMAHMLVR